MLKTDRHYPRRGGAIDSIIYFVQFVVIIWAYFQLWPSPEQIVPHLIFILAVSAILETIAVVVVVFTGRLHTVSKVVICSALGSIAGCIIAAWTFGAIPF